MEQPLVTIGIPTYNRPMGLKKTLIAITNQTYNNIEIIVSDNGSSSNETETIVLEFIAQDKRIKYFKQSENKGIFFNWQFVLEQAKGDYFMWAADDDEWKGTDFLNTLMLYAPKNILAFPDAIVKEKSNLRSYPIKSFENCNDKLDYIKNFVSCGWGYPMYGLFNLKLFYQYGLQFKFANDLSYYMEGEFLHKLFLAGPVKYVKEATIIYSPLGSEPSIDLRIESWLKYFKRTLIIYKNSDLSSETKHDLIKAVLDIYTAYAKNLFEELVSYKELKNNIKPIIKNKTTILNKIILRIKVTFMVLVKGHY